MGVGVPRCCLPRKDMGHTAREFILKGKEGARLDGRHTERRGISFRIIWTVTSSS